LPGSKKTGGVEPSFKVLLELSKLPCKEKGKGKGEVHGRRKITEVKEEKEGDYVALASNPSMKPSKLNAKVELTGQVSRGIVETFVIHGQILRKVIGYLSPSVIQECSTRTKSK